MTRRALLLFGLLAALAYPIGDIVGGMAWRGYSYASQGVSELMAFGTQSRAAVLAIMTGANQKVVIPAKAGIHCRRRTAREPRYGPRLSPG